MQPLPLVMTYHSIILSCPFTDNYAVPYYEYSQPDAPSTSTECITIIGGFSRTCRDFRQIQHKWRAQGYAVLIIDNRGAGQSHAEQSFDFSTFTTDILSVWQCCQITHSHLIGFSMGGLISQFVATEHPHQVQSLTLVSTFSGMVNSTLAPPNHEQALWYAPEQYVAKIFAQRYPYFLQALARDITKKSNDPHTHRQAAYQRQAFESAPLPVSHHLISSPTLIIHGAEDAVIETQAAHELHAAIAGSTLKIYPECGHLPLVETGEQLFEDISKFIQNASSAA